MAALQLSQVQGSDIITQSALQVGFGTRVAEVLGFNFGDPDLIQQVATHWSAASTRVTVAAQQIAATTSNGVTATKDAVKSTWTGTAGTAFFQQEQLLENSFASVKTAMDAVSTSLSGFAKEIQGAWMSSVATTLALIVELRKLWDEYGPGVSAFVKQKIQNVGTGGPATPSQPVVIPGPGNTTVQTVPPLTSQAAPNNNTAASAQSTWSLVLQKIKDLINWWIIALLAHMKAMNSYNQQVTLATNSLVNSLTSDKAILPNGGLPAVPALSAS
jgi:uncharacterized protein YukE